MKKIILVLAVILAVGFTFTSCKNDKKAETTEEAAKEIASNDEVYQCPMDCENGKSYVESGKCPTCKMALKAKKAGEVSEHKHGDACTCKDGGECKCPKGECKCGDKAKECTKCPEGECKCGDKAHKECTKCPEGKCTGHKDDAKKECTKCGKDKECTCPHDKDKA